MGANTEAPGAHRPTIAIGPRRVHVYLAPTHNVTQCRVFRGDGQVYCPHECRTDRLYVALGLAAWLSSSAGFAPRAAAPRYAGPRRSNSSSVSSPISSTRWGSVRLRPPPPFINLRRIVPDELIPGTLNVGHTPAAIAETLIFVTAILVDPLLIGRHGRQLRRRGLARRRRRGALAAPGDSSHHGHRAC